MIRGALLRLLPRPLRAAVRRRLLERRVAAFPSRVARHRYGGRELAVRIGDATAEAWYDRDWDEPPELALLRERGRLRPGARVFDLGAHQGLVALLLERAVSPGGTVLAVEASPHDAAVAAENLRLNAPAAVELLHAAVAARPGTVHFGLHGEVADGGGDWPTVEVEAVTIDGLAERYGPPDVLFLDVEGFEDEALSGAAAVLVRRPDAFVEVHGDHLPRFGASVERVLAHFPADAYELLAADPDEGVFRPLDRASPPRGRFFLVALARA